MTRDIQKFNGKEVRKIVFWESLTGQKYQQKDPRVNYLYRKIGSVFNNENLYANLQDEESVFKTDFIFENQKQWKTMGNLNEFEFATIQNIKAQRLTQNMEKILEEEEDIEQELRDQLSVYREADGLLTKFDDDLSYSMSVALTNYETDKLYGVTFGQEEFQSSIKKKVPTGHVFKAFPIQFTHKNTRNMFETMRRNPNCEEIVKANGDQMHFCLRVKQVNYPEDIFALWVVIGLRYVPIGN